MINNSSYRFERLSRENIHHLIHLFKSVFKKDVTLSFLLGKYDTDYIGKSFLGHIAFENEKPVSYGGYVPYKIKLGENIIIGAQSVDSMSLPEASGKGVFRMIYHLNIELLKAENIYLAYGFANQLSNPVFVDKFGWSLHHHLQTFVIPVGGTSIYRVFKKLGISVQNESKTNSIIDELLVDQKMENPFLPDGKDHIVYDECFFKYKSFQKQHIVSINGIKVWIKLGNVLSIGNIEHCSKQDFHNTVSELVNLGFKLKLNKIILQYSENSIQAAALREKFVPIKGLAVIYKFFNTQNTFKNAMFSYGDIDTF